MKKSIRICLSSVLACGGLVALPALSQESSPLPAAEVKTVLDSSLWVTPRSSGLAGAAAPTADGMDAPDSNPAGIGGVNIEGSLPLVRLLTFPYLGAAANENAHDMRKDMTASTLEDPVLKQALLDGAKDKRFYGRASFVPAFGFSRTFVAYINDTQVAAVPYGGGTSLIQTHYRFSTGPVFGFSATNPSQTIALGATVAQLTREEIATDLTFAQIDSPDLRKQALKQQQKTYAGTAANVGLSWQLARAAKPTFSLVSHNVGATKYKLKKSKEPATNIIEKESISLAFGLSPQLGKNAYLNFVIQGDELDHHDIAIEKKLKTSLELTLGKGFGYYSLLGLRAGYNAAGVSAGASLHIGMISLEVASYAVDLATDNHRTIERRTAAIFNANIAK
jgi:hypothetical protein